jgi:hypothetical protein
MRSRHRLLYLLLHVTAVSAGPVFIPSRGLEARVTEALTNPAGRPFSESSDTSDRADYWGGKFDGANSQGSKPEPEPEQSITGKHLSRITEGPWRADMRRAMAQ